MNINRTNRRTGTRGIDLRWAAALAFAAAAFSACGSDPPERQAVANEASADAPAQRAQIAASGVAFDSGEQQDQERFEVEQRAALIRRAQASDRHLQTLADQVSQRAADAHRELQSQGSDQHLENIAADAASDASDASEGPADGPSCKSNRLLSTQSCAV